MEDNIEWGGADLLMVTGERKGGAVGRHYSVQSSLFRAHFIIIKGTLCVVNNNCHIIVKKGGAVGEHYSVQSSLSRTHFSVQKTFFIIIQNTLFIFQMIILFTPVTNMLVFILSSFPTMWIFASPPILKFSG